MMIIIIINICLLTTHTHAPPNRLAARCTRVDFEFMKSRKIMNSAMLALRHWKAFEIQKVKSQQITNKIICVRLVHCSPTLMQPLAKDTWIRWMQPKSTKRAFSYCIYLYMHMNPYVLVTFFHALAFFNKRLLYLHQTSRLCHGIQKVRTFFLFSSLF